jgi:hypothetical protein
VPTALEPRVDLLVVPGGGWRARRARGTPRRVRARRAAGRHRQPPRARLNRRLGVHPMLLVKGGVLDRRWATSHAAVIADLRRHPVEVHAKACVVDGSDVLSCGGVKPGLDLSLHLFERFSRGRRREGRPPLGLRTSAGGGARLRNRDLHELPDRHAGHRREPRRRAASKRASALATTLHGRCWMTELWLSAVREI